MADWLQNEPSKWIGPHARTMYREPAHAAPLPPFFSPADQVPHSARVSVPNSFTGMSDATAERVEKMQNLLQKTLGPDQVANRPGGGGTKLSYLEGWRAINLANEVFGYNGWYTDIKYLEADFIDYLPETQKWNVGVTAIVRVRLQDGASHEDVGYGKLENSKSKADALDKCKKEAVTDALKRALRHFGKLLGNCLYDKHYLEGLSKMKAPKPKFDFDEIYKPERDNLRPTIPLPGPAVGTSMGPPPAPASRGTAEPTRKGHPPPLPPRLAAQARRASTVSASTVSASTVTPRGAPIATSTTATASHAPTGPTPRRTSTVATVPAAPNPYDRTGAQTDFPLNSEDEEMYAAVDLGADDGVMGEGRDASGGELESGTGMVYFEGDSGFGEVDGLSDASFVSTKPPGPLAAAKPLAPEPQRVPPQQLRNSPPGPDTSMERLQASKAAAQARLAEANKRKAAEAAQAQMATHAPGGPRGDTGSTDGRPMVAASASAATLLRLGTARPPALRPPQAPPRRNNSLTGSDGVVGEDLGPKLQVKVAGALPALAVGAGLARAASAVHTGGTATVTSPGRQRSTLGGPPPGGSLSEVPSHAGFISARGVKRGLSDDSYDLPSPPGPIGVAGPRAPGPGRAPLLELDIDDIMGNVKRQKGVGG